MEKVKSVRLNSANVKYDNSVDTERVYDIESNVNFQYGNIVSFDGGVVRKDEVVKATFTKYGNNQESLTFQNVEREEKFAIVEAVDAFFEEVQSAIEVSPINI